MYLRDLKLDYTLNTLNYTNNTIIQWLSNINNSSNELIDFETFLISEAKINSNEVGNYYDEVYTISKTTFSSLLDQYFLLSLSRFDKLKDNMAQTISFAIISTLILLVFVVLFGISVSYLTIRSIIRPLKRISNVSKDIAQGNLNRSLKTDYEADDEFGQLSSSFAEMTDSLADIVIVIMEASNNLAVSSLDLASSSKEVNTSSQEISIITQKISIETQNQSKLAKKSLIETENLKTEFKEKIREISVASNLIKTITSQVNMLALNASIEAARAGEYGRGFSVVAENIQELANKAKISLEHVNRAVNDLDKSLGSSINAIRESANEIAIISENTASGIEEASAATEEQTAIIQEITVSSQELAQLSIKLKDYIKHFNVSE